MIIFSYLKNKQTNKQNKIKNKQGTNGITLVVLLHKANTYNLPPTYFPFGAAWILPHRSGCK